LREDAAFFREHHYLDPLGVDDSDNPMLWRATCMFFCVYDARVFILRAFLLCVYIDALAAAFEDT
jgi:hypothetical protein